MAVAKLSAWDSHEWKTRSLKLGGVPLTQHICAKCGRNFVDEAATGVRYAVHVGAMRFNRLSDETTAQWLFDDCPGERLKDDEVSLETRYSPADEIAAEYSKKRSN